jgi:short-subunit dehydrogenase
MAATRDWAVITGATGDIGQAFAKLFARDGINLVLTARKGTALATLAAELEHDFGVKTLVYAGDLTDLDTAKDLLEAIQEAHIHVKYLVNNAGFGVYGPFVLSHWSTEQEMLQVNIIALTYLAKAFARIMKRRKVGRIINIASLAAFLPGPNMAVYYATKAYVLSLSQAMHEELRSSGVTVTALCPGPTGKNFAHVADAAQAALFKGKLTPPVYVAEYGYRAMMAGRPVAVPTFKAKIIAFATRLIPRQLMGKFSAYLLR